MKITSREIEFLSESNAIEGEYSKRALEDAKEAWEYAKENRAYITGPVILHIHKILMQRIRPDIAGKLRKCDVCG